MKHTKMILSLALALLLVCGLAACGSSEPTQLSGTYSASAYGTTMSYTFQEDTVIVRYSLADNEIAEYEGTYALQADDSQIVLTFDPAQTEHAVLPAGMASLGGVFTFQQGEAYIVIGPVRYDKTEASENGGESL